MSRRLVVALIAVAVTLGCKKDGERKAPVVAEDAAGQPADTRPERVVVSRIDLRAVASEPGMALDREALVNGVRHALLDSKEFVADLQAVPATHQPRVAAIEVAARFELDNSGDQPVARVAVESRVAWADRGADPAPTENLAVELPVPAEAGDTESVARALLANAVATAAAGLAAKEHVRSGGRDALRAAIGGELPDVDLELWALEVIREGRRADGFDAAVAALRSPSREVRESAVGALIALGDPRAVKPIADATDTTDGGFVRLAIEAAASLGGDEAASYLEFLARGHSDEDVRAAARRGLDRLAAAVDGGQAMP